MPVETMDDRRRGRWASLSKSPPPPHPETLKVSSAAQQRQQQQHQTPPCASDHASHTKTEDGAATSIGPSDTGTDASAPQHQHPTLAGSTPDPSPSQLPSYRSKQRPPADTSRSVSVSAQATPDRVQTKASIPSSARRLSLRPRCTCRTHLCGQSLMVPVVVP